MGILARAMRGDRVDRATRSSAGRTYADGDRGVEHWLNHGITGRSRWIELAWLSIAASLLAIVIRRFGCATERKSPRPLSAALCQDLGRRALNPSFAGKFVIPPRRARLALNQGDWF